MNERKGRKRPVLIEEANAAPASAEAARLKPRQEKPRHEDVASDGATAARASASGAQEPINVQDAPPVPDAVTAPVALPEGVPVGRSIWPRIFWWALGLLVSAGVALSITNLVNEMLAKAPVLGWVLLAISIVAALAFVVLALRELAALARMRSVDALRRRAVAAREDHDNSASRMVVEDLTGLYAHRTDLAWSREELRERMADVPDPAARLDLYEQTVLGPLDELAQVEIRAASRRVAATTALMPSAMLDAGAALYFNLRMIRRIAQIYSGRSGLASSVRLARKVVEHAMAAGLIAVGEDLLEPLIGGGIASKLSRRAGEGVVNGALTARIGLAAMEVCRPLPFVARSKPKLRSLAWRAVSGR
ncbi:MAG: TIGR01620 family protein [Neomegalonema sp.]|nr:TIGR01620 family protein [Neomegalonema sp.]